MNDKLNLQATSHLTVILTQAIKKFIADNAYGLSKRDGSLVAIEACRQAAKELVMELRPMPVVPAKWNIDEVGVYVAENAFVLQTEFMLAISRFAENKCIAGERVPAAIPSTVVTTALINSLWDYCKIAGVPYDGVIEIASTFKKESS